MAVTLYNTLTRKTEPFVPKQAGTVRMYYCGPTVYDVPHAGHARSAVAFDVLVRVLRGRGLSVTFVRNVTDIDDKILNRSREVGEDPLSLSRRMTDVYQREMSALGCLAPSFEPKVSDHLESIFEMMRKLIDHGAAYVVDREGGKRDIYFSVRSFAGYGKLSRRRLDELVVGARVEADETKRDPLDFALWKGAAADEWGWDSPWGRGRPGWHIECSAMSSHYLGHGFDIHGGGMDLIFPHHENEIAQSEAARPGEGPFARFWVHNGFVNVDKEKMSKSLGNFVTVRDVFERNDPEAFRWFLLTVHYRGPIQFDTATVGGRVICPGVDEAERRVDYVYATLERLADLEAQASPATVLQTTKLTREFTAAIVAIEGALNAAEAALDDDLNTPVALAELGEIARHANEVCDVAAKKKDDPMILASAVTIGGAARVAIAKIAEQLGLITTPVAQYRARTRERRLRLRGLSVEDIDRKVVERTEARKNKDFARSDSIRDELLRKGVSLRDGPAGTVWTVEA